MWKQFVHGNVNFSVEDAPAGFINKLQKFSPRNITTEDNKTVFNVNLRCKSDVIKTIGKLNYTARENKNIFSLLNFFYRRAVLVVTAIICIAGFITLDRFAFKIKINGLDGEEYSKVSQYLQENGITRFAPKNTEKIHKTAREIVEKFDFIADASARVIGTSIVFSVLRAEYVIADTADIAAVCGGVISRIIVISGTASVTVGEVVRTGDILVKGPRANAIIYINNGTELVCIFNNIAVTS